MFQSPIAAIHHQIDNIPPLPATVTYVLDVIANPDSSADDLMRAILPDQTLYLKNN